jgi:hypothetical protein
VDALKGCGVNPDTGLVEIVERGSSFFIGAIPEYKKLQTHIP